MAIYLQKKMLLLQKYIFWQILKSSLDLLNRSLMQQKMIMKMRMQIGKCHHQGGIKSAKLWGSSVVLSLPQWWRAEDAEIVAEIETLYEISLLKQKHQSLITDIFKL